MVVKPDVRVVSSSSLRLELAQITEADKRALSLKGKTKVYEQATKWLEKAKAALTKATDGADSDGENLMYDKKVVSAAHKLTAARTKLRHAHTAYEQSLGARRALDDAALCTDNASLRAYLVQYSLADSVDGSERRLLKVSSRPTTVSLEPCQPTTSSSRHGSNATEANPSTSARGVSSDRALTPPLPATESGKVEAKFEWPSDVELIERVESDPDWPSDVELIAPRKRKASRTVIQGDVKRVKNN
ncbi:uncharacterized protein ARMOST_22188 [Armillaria ostoyae]|uniref:Uncharacterized protein n=1 Tax=Armillaria ostoyae TaxID=47428 RepID=A0A284SC61_ARMOS|nr:uncharacterized protein ARMOST_22188 [Armillaria ostoyae]